MRFDVQQEAKIKADLVQLNRRERNEINKEKGGGEIRIEDLDVREDLDVTQNYGSQQPQVPPLAPKEKFSAVNQSHDFGGGKSTLKRRDPNAAYVPGGVYQSETPTPQPQQQQVYSNRSALNIPPESGRMRPPLGPTYR